MVEGTCNKCAKYLLFAFNVLFLIAGALFIIVGSVVQASVAGPMSAAIFLIVVGGIIFIVSFFGCFGAIKENRCMLITFAVLLGVILLLCVIGAIIGFVYEGKAEEIAYNWCYSYITEYNNSDAVMAVTDSFQRGYKCCGIYNYTDWRDNAYYNETNSVPDSCCKNETVKCGRDGLRNPDKINKKGCISYIEEKFETGYVIIGAVSAAVALTMILGIVLSCCLASAIKQGYNTV